MRSTAVTGSARGGGASVAKPPKGSIGGEKVLLLKPLTYMNESGRAVGEAMRFYKLAPADVLVIHDEVDLPPGKLRMKAGGGAAGHNGLRSISGAIGDGYRRMRIGVGHPGVKEAVPHYVLHDFAKADREWLEPMIEAIADHARPSRRRQGQHLRQPHPRGARRRGEEDQGQAPEKAARTEPEPSRRRRPSRHRRHRADPEDRGRPPRPRTQEAVRRLKHPPPAGLPSCHLAGAARGAGSMQNDRLAAVFRRAPEHAVPAQSVQAPAAPESARTSRGSGGRCGR